MNGHANALRADHAKSLLLGKSPAWASLMREKWAN